MVGGEEKPLYEVLILILHSCLASGQNPNERERNCAAKTKAYVTVLERHIGVDVVLETVPCTMTLGQSTVIHASRGVLEPTVLRPVGREPIEVIGYPGGCIHHR